MDGVLLQIVDAGEAVAHAERPGERRGVERQPLLDLLEQVEGMAPLAVELVDEGDDGDVAQPADLEQLERARLDAAGGVDHHDGRIDRGQRPVGVFGEILVAGRVEQVEDGVAIFEGHHRGDDRDAALALHLHPVGTGLAAVGLGAHLAGKLDGAAEEQQLLGQRGLAGVRVRDDREGAPAGSFVGKGHRRDCGRLCGDWSQEGPKRGRPPTTSIPPLGTRCRRAAVRQSKSGRRGSARFRGRRRSGGCA